MKRVKIVERKLGREGNLGQQIGDLIEIDPRQNSKEYLDTLIHECLHACFPDLSEQAVVDSANVITDAVWRQNYRRIQK
jgi:hypothetical protein